MESGLRNQLNQVFGGQSLMITDANRFAFVILRLVRLHSKLAGGHGNLGARPMHQVINALRVVHVCTIGVAFRIYNKRPTLVKKISLDGVFLPIVAKSGSKEALGNLSIRESVITDAKSP